MQLMSESSGRFAHGFAFLSDRGHQCFVLDSLTPLVALDSVRAVECSCGRALLDIPVLSA